MRMVSFIAANKEPKMYKELYESTDYAEVFEVYLMNCCSNVQG